MTLTRKRFADLEPGDKFVYRLQNVSFLMRYVRGATSATDLRPWCFGNGKSGPFNPGDDAVVWVY